MHSIRLEIEDSVFEKIINFLKKLPMNKVKITEETSTSKHSRPLKLNAIQLQTKSFQFNREEANER